MPAGAKMFGEGGELSFSGSNRLIFDDNCEAVNLKIYNRGSGFQPVIKLDYQKDNCVVKDCNIFGGIWMNVPTSATVQGNSIETANGYGIFADGGQSCTITGNSLHGASSQYGMQLSGNFKDNTISNNVIDGESVCKTGIVILPQTVGEVLDNTIYGNTVSDVTEEGISIDYDNAPASGEVSTYSGNILTWTGSAPSTGMTLTVLSGISEGGYARVASVSGSNITLEDQTFTSLSAGDDIEIGHAPRDNVIRDNTVSGAGKTGIMLYGAQAGTEVYDNEVSDSGTETHPTYEGRIPYHNAGMSMLALNVITGHSRPVSCSFTGNTIENCEYGITYGNAYWVIGDRAHPVSKTIGNNNLVDCTFNEYEEWA